MKCLLAHLATAILVATTIPSFADGVETPVSLGMTATINIADLQIDLGRTITNFAIAGSYTDPVKNNGKLQRKTLTIVAKEFGGGVPLTVEWTNAIKLYAPAALSAYYSRGIGAAQFLADGKQAASMPFTDLSLKGKRFDNKPYVGLLPGQSLVLMPPQIEAVLDVGGASTLSSPVGGNEIVTVKGKYFGKNAPKVYMEYKDAKGKILQFNCSPFVGKKYLDAQGMAKSSATDPTTGASEIQLLTPSKFPTGWIHGDNTLVIDSGVGLATATIQTVDKAALYPEIPASYKFPLNLPPGIYSVSYKGSISGPGIDRNYSGEEETIFVGENGTVAAYTEYKSQLDDKLADLKKLGITPTITFTPYNNGFFICEVSASKKILFIKYSANLVVTVTRIAD